jgi:hypothetical protein
VRFGRMGSRFQKKFDGREAQRGAACIQVTDS